MSLATLNDIFFAIADRRNPKVLMYRGAIDWVAISSQEFARNVINLALVLKQWGIERGDRIAILSENRPEWVFTDFASLFLGAVTVPIYSTLTDLQTGYVLRDSGAKVAVISTASQLNKILAIKNQTALERIVVMDAVETGHAVHMQRIIQDSPSAGDAVLTARARAIRPEDLATIIYTSGTTGISKGVMLTHRNLASNISCSLEGFSMKDGETSVSFLPLSHVTARHVDLALLYRGVTLAYWKCDRPSWLRCHGSTKRSLARFGRRPESSPSVKSTTGPYPWDALTNQPFWKERLLHLSSGSWPTAWSIRKFVRD
jgi:long-chain acyl-CoA synthetase